MDTYEIVFEIVFEDENTQELIKRVEEKIDYLTKLLRFDSEGNLLFKNKHTTTLQGRPDLGISEYDEELIERGDY